MIEKIVRTAGAAALLLAFVGGIAKAEDFPATPVQAGAPRNLPGEALVPGAQQVADLIDSAIQPILQPILAPGEAPAAAAAPAGAALHGHHHHHHLAARHHPHHIA